LGITGVVPATPGTDETAARIFAAAGALDVIRSMGPVMPGP